MFNPSFVLLMPDYIKTIKIVKKKVKEK